MEYQWPIINTLDDILPAIEGRDEFVIAEREWGYVVNYFVNLIDTFPRTNTKDPALNERYAIRRECRGIKFGLDKKIIARPFHKFFNINERPETHDNLINWDDNFIILEKLDGSMVHPIHVDKLIWCTKMGDTDVSKLAAAFVAENKKYEDIAMDLIGLNYLPLFEFCSRSQRIVIDYPEDNLVLLAVRHNITGEYMSYNTMVEVAAKHNIPVVQSFTGTFDGINKFLTDVITREGEEGYVIRFENGHAVKVKNVWYLQLHKTKELMSHEKDVWTLVLNNNHDDAKAFMEEDDQKNLDEFAEDLYTAITNKADELNWIVIAAKDNIGESKKKFAEFVLREHKDVSGLLFSIWDDKKPYDVVMNMIMKSLGSGPKLEKVRHLANGIKWEDYRDRS